MRPHAPPPCRPSLPSLTSLLVTSSTTLFLPSLEVSPLTLGDKFNHPLDTLPSTLIFLFLGYNFEQYIDAASLPPSLTHLSHRGLGYFSPPITSLPSTLTYLYLYSDCSSCLSPLPNLTHLVHELCREVIVPTSLTHLEIVHTYDEYSVNFLLPSLTYLLLGDRFNTPLNLCSIFLSPTS
jgi:hypothetical protein